MPKTTQQTDTAVSLKGSKLRECAQNRRPQAQKDTAKGHNDDPKATVTRYSRERVAGVPTSANKYTIILAEGAMHDLDVQRGLCTVGM